VSSGVRAWVMSLDSPPNGIAFPLTSPLISWSMVRRGARTSGSSCLRRRCLSISAIVRARNVDCSEYSDCRQHDNSLFHRASLTKTKEATSGFQVGIPTTKVRKGRRGSGEGSPRYGVNQRREQGSVASGRSNNPMLYDRSDLKRSIDRSGARTQLALRVPRFHQYQFR